MGGGNGDNAYRGASPDHLPKARKAGDMDAVTQQKEAIAGARHHLQASGAEHRDFTEHWDKQAFIASAVAANAASFGYAFGVVGFANIGLGPAAASCVPLFTIPLTLGWAYLGYRDMSRRSSTLAQNFPGLVWCRYALESIRAEIREYFIIDDDKENPISRSNRGMIYKRSKLAGESIPFGTKKDVYQKGYEWLNHSVLYPRHVEGGWQTAGRVLVGGRGSVKKLGDGLCGWRDRPVADGGTGKFPWGADHQKAQEEAGQHTSSVDASASAQTSSPFGTGAKAPELDKHVGNSKESFEVVDPETGVIPYHASIFNISGMSYGALSDAATKALNWGAAVGDFYHNTGEGGVSDHHRYAQADVVWNVGTGYFGCRDRETGGFSEENFVATLKKSANRIKMIEVKLSQGAKPGHGGILPAAKITPEIEAIRGIKKEDGDCISPPWHKEFHSPDTLCLFLDKIRKLSKRPTGFKLCMGKPNEFVAIIKAVRKFQDENGRRCLDFITIDGGEGGTGAAPMEFSNRVGTPLRDGLILVDDVLRGAGLRDQVAVICSGKITHGFSIVRALALGADACNSARGMMIALGCIQSLKCNTNKCPTGITTFDPLLVQGLDVPLKAVRVTNYHHQTVNMACELAGAAGYAFPAELKRADIMLRLSDNEVATYEDLYPTVAHGCLAEGKARPELQHLWDSA